MILSETKGQNVHFKMHGCGFIIINSQLAEHRVTAVCSKKTSIFAQSLGGQGLFTMQEPVLQITKIVLVHAYSISANSRWSPGVFSMQQNLCPRLPGHTFHYHRINVLNYTSAQR